MPGYGITTSDEGLLPWEWARERLESAHNYWLASADRDGTPHLAVVWGVWHEEAFLFSTSPRSRKAHDLTHRPQCSVALEGGAESVVVQGVATLVGHPQAVAALYEAKYGEGFPDALWRVKPRTVIAVLEAAFTTAATRWTFDD
jgi:general stress protein 26